MPSEVVIKAHNLSKCYHIYDQPINRLKQFLFPSIRRIFGLEPKVYFREFWALQSVSFEVARGETVGIIGRNGAGKSTLLQMLCGTLHPTEGSVETSGRVAALLELGSGFNMDFTGRENVYLNAAVWGLSKKEVGDRFDDIVSFAEIGDFIDQPVKTYSSGMMMRLAFAVIAHVDADVLIVDEALSVGDAFFTQKCMRFLRNFMAHGTVLFVSHDTGAVVNLCQRAIWLHQGTIRGVDTPKVLADRYLADMYAEKQGGSDTIAPVSVKAMRTQVDGKPQGDQRLQYINKSNLRNDLEIFEFDPDAGGFGKNGARIVDVRLLQANGEALAWCVGGESVVLRIRCLSSRPMFSPIVGFLVKDRLGQILFGDNSYLTYCETPLNLGENEIIEASFSFVMPILPVGDYSFCVALAEGTQSEHVQHHWIHDALVFRSHASSAANGLVGIPMNSIHIEILENVA